MTSRSSTFGEFHWLLGILQNVDMGLVVLDRAYRIKLWNGFMENHSGHPAAAVLDKELFELFPDIPRQWLQRKIDTVFLLNNRAFSTWQQRPYVFRFDSYRPITGGSERMFQNTTLFPLTSLTGDVEHVCMMVYDVTDMALDEMALQEANRELERLGRTDGLTGLNNRRAWEELLTAEFKRHRRNGQPCSLVMFDIDHFKRVNDTYGHQAGDEVIREVSRTLKKVSRESDFAGRYGGEEFGVILVDTDANGALQFAERLRSAIEATSVEHEGEAIRFTISLGIAPLGGDERDQGQWIERADQALYRSKEGGRNRTSIHGAAAVASAK